MIDMNVIENLAKYGFSGLIIGVLGFYIWSTDKFRRNERGAVLQEHNEERDKIFREHKEEREEWRVQWECQFKKIIEITSEHAKVIGEFKGILKAIEREVTRS